LESEVALAAPDLCVLFLKYDGWFKLKQHKFG